MFENRAREILDALQGYNLLRTDLNGWIHVTTDGEMMWVEVEREIQAGSTTLPSEKASRQTVCCI
ncbi:MAG: hypothetical protein EHM70_09645 [Chloroflexota bacterium]|nr:MAG: hypothetical protein EHM70_09645 [Chloroflexota bacterium]